MRTTILNTDYSIISVISWEQGMTLLFKNVIVPIEFWEQQIRSGDGTLWQVPKIAVVKKFVKHRRKLHPTKKNIFMRDNYTCAYCGDDNPRNMTIDHILPKSRRGKDTWENLITACYDCNHKKADRTPEEAGMVLKWEPHHPNEKLWNQLK